jgi:hypothetical protein
METEMKNNKAIEVLILAVMFVWIPIFMGAAGDWDKDKPSASTTLRASNPEILTNFSALEDVIGQDHEFSTGGTNTGKHIQITFDDPLSSAPATVEASEGVLYLLDVSSKAELHFEDEDENTIQLTSAGDLYSSTNLQVAGTSTFTGAVTANGGITLGAGDDLIGSSTSDITFNNNKFTVAGATGDTVIAGTCDIAGPTEVTGVATLGDGSLLKTSALPTTDAMIANKKYVDDMIKNHVILTDEKAQNTDGGTFTAGSWEKRTVTEKSDTESLCSVSSSVITLSAGTYLCHITCPAVRVSYHQARLQNTTGASTLVLGTTEISSTSDSTQSRSVIIGIFTVAASQSLEIQHQCATSYATGGFGLAANFTTEVYTIAHFWKIG